MPILTNTSGSSGAEYRYDLDDAPTGTYPAVLCDMKHTSGAKVPSFDDPTVLEDKDLSVFLFSYEHEGEVHFADMGNDTVQLGAIQVVQDAEKHSR